MQPRQMQIHTPGKEEAIVVVQTGGCLSSRSAERTWGLEWAVSYMGLSSVL